jgi:hypothetical protein
MNVNIFIIRVLKLVFMKYCRILVIIFVIIAFLLVPVSATLSLEVGGYPPGSARITANAPVFLGETNLDISIALNGYTMIAWWPPGADMSTDPAVSLAVPDPSNFTIDLNDFSGHLGTWYSYGKQPYFPVFTVVQPQIDLKVWDMDHNTDVTGQSVPLATNITYRIDTNLWQALNYTYRPYVNPTSTFFTVTLTNPKGALVPQIYTASIGAQNIRILAFDSNPVISSTPYYSQVLLAWNHLALSTDGTRVYPAGTYILNVSQNLNNMIGSYSASPSVNTIGILTSGDKTVTFLPAPSPTSPAPTVQATSTVTQVPSAIQTVATNPTKTVVPVKTTYSSLPVETVITGTGLAAVIILYRRQNP